MNLRSVDLNLLVIFDALMEERHVTRAAQKIPISQPAMSNALARLRHLFKDELFIRSVNGMEPTPRALELGGAVRQILRQAERLLTSDIGFDPATVEREFTARVSDLIGYLVLPRLLQELRNRAPRIRLDLLHMSPEATIRGLEADELDFGLSMSLAHSNAIRSADLFSDQMVCVMRSAHPMRHEKLTLSRFLKLEHVKVAISPTDTRFVDNVLAERGVSRNIVARVPHWLLIPAILQHTDMVSVISAKLAAHFGHDLVAKPLPFSSESFFWKIYWHRRHENSRPHSWMREQVIACCSHL